MNSSSMNSLTHALANGKLPPDRPKPSRPPSVADWEIFRSTISGLYITEQKKLQDVQSILANQYGFKASRRSYKARLRQWAVHKYYRPPDKDSPTGESSLSIRNKLSPSTSTTYVPPRAENPFLTAEEVDDLKDALESSNADCVSSQRTTPELSLSTSRPETLRTQSGVEGQVFSANLSRPPSPNPARILTSSFSSIETMLNSIRVFTETQLSQNSGLTSKSEAHEEHSATREGARSLTKRQWRRTEYIFSKFHQGLGMLEANEFEDAFENLQQGCQLAENFLRRPPRLLFSSLYIVLGCHKWLRHESVRCALLTYLSNMATTKLGDSHPIATAMSSLPQDDLLRESAEAVFRSTIDLLETRLGPLHNETLRLKMGLCVILSRQGEFRAAESLIRALCRQCEQHYGRSHPSTRKCLRRLGNLYLSQGRTVEAEHVFEDVVRRGATHAGPADEISIYTFQTLGTLCAQRGHCARSEFWYEKELEAALERWGAGDEYYVDCCERREARVKSPGNPFGMVTWLEIT